MLVLIVMFILVSNLGFESAFNVGFDCDVGVACFILVLDLTLTLVSLCFWFWC